MAIIGRESPDLTASYGTFGRTARTSSAVTKVFG